MPRALTKAQAKRAEEVRRAEKRARGLVTKARVASTHGLGTGVLLNDEGMYDLIHAIVSDVLEGVQSNPNLAKYLPKAAKAAARVIRAKGS